METLSIVVVILQALGAILAIVLRCYQLRQVTRKNDQTNSTKEKSEPSASIRVAHLGNDAIDIFDISIH